MPSLNMLCKWLKDCLIVKLATEEMRNK